MKNKNSTKNYDYDNDMDFIEDDDDYVEDEITDCPNCHKTYDDADADFLICHHCGYDVEKGIIDTRKKSHSLKGLGIDPDVTMDDWS